MNAEQNKKSQQAADLYWCFNAPGICSRQQDFCQFQVGPSSNSKTQHQEA